MRFFLIHRVIPEEGLYVFNMHSIVQKHFLSALQLYEAGAGR
jgi:hypothetical protein